MDFKNRDAVTRHEIMGSQNKTIVNIKECFTINVGIHGILAQTVNRSNVILLHLPHTRFFSIYLAAL